jgi:hypothetical protein
MLLDIDKLKVDEIQPKMSAMMNRLRHSRPVDFSADADADFSANVDDANQVPFSIDQAIQTATRLKREVVQRQEQQQQQQQQQQPGYVSFLESTALTLASINTKLVDLLQSKLTDATDAVVQATDRRHLQLEKLINRTNAHGLSASAETADDLMHHVEVVNDGTLTELRQQKLSAEKFQSGVSDQFSGINRTLDRRFGQISELLDAASQSLEMNANASWSEMSRRLNATGDRIQAAVVSLAKQLKSAENQTRDSIQAFVDEKLKVFGSWLVDSLVDRLKPDSSSSNDNGDVMNLTQFRSLVNDDMDRSEKMLVRQLSLTENRTRDRLDRLEDTVNRTLLRFDAQTALIDDTRDLISNQSSVSDHVCRCNQDRLPSWWEQLMNILYGTVPPHSEHYHAQSLDQLFDLNKALVIGVGILMYLVRAIDSQCSASLAKSAGILRPWWTKVD